MNRNFTKILVLAFLVITAFTACIKNNDSLLISKENLVGTYTLITQKEKITGRPEKDVTNEYNKPCELDDQTILRSDFSATYVDAGTKCSAIDSWTTTWSLDGNVLIIAGEEFTIKTLTKTTLVLEQNNVLGSVVVTTTSTYRKY